jgi:putative DNA methylase
MTTSRKKLIEVALPLDAINKASAREKSIRHGHPSTLHLWWARRPLAAARAVIFAQMVDDPSTLTDLFPTEKKQQKERGRLFRIIEELVQWENTTNEEVLERARREIWQSWRRACAENADHPRAKELFDRYKLPAFHDPFAGGGALPLEAQRLGLEAYASDLNPVAVLINKAMIEIPPRFAGKPPVNPEAHKEKTLIARNWKGAQGLAEDVRYYGNWMRNEAEKGISDLYPKVAVSAEMAKERPDLKHYVGQELMVIAWLWVRTVKSPNPAFSNVDVPLAATFMLGTKPGKEVYVEPVMKGETYGFVVRVGKPKNAAKAKHGTKHSRGANFQCVMSGAPIAGNYVKAEAAAGRMGSRLLAIVAEGERGRVYLQPLAEHEAMARKASPEWKPEIGFYQQALGFRVGNYGMTLWSDVFTERQLTALTTFADLVLKTRERVKVDALYGQLASDDALAYADAVATYLGLAVGRVSDYCSTVCTWANNPQMEIVRGTFARQALPMTWDFAEANPFGPSTGSFDILLGWITKVLERLPANHIGVAFQDDAAQAARSPTGTLVSTDPPYFDNIGYADLSDFFYVWLRRALKPVYPDLFTTVAVPKAEELVATPGRHGGRENAESFFLKGMSDVIRHLAQRSHPGFPISVYYAFKQSESDDEHGTANTGWDTFLEAVIRSGFAISGTWPIRTERGGRSREIGSSALASSIVLVCRPRPADAPTATRRELVAALRAELPEALRRLQEGNIAPVDLAQASIGPGMAVYTHYSKVLDAEGKPVSVRDALALINQVLDETLTEQEGDFDADSRFALAWFEQHGFSEGDFGVAETLSKAKNTSVSGLAEAGILESRRGKVRLVRPEELPDDWDPTDDARLTNWETVHHLIRVLEAGGESSAAGLVGKLGSKAETARELAYRLYTVCERKKRAAEALSYNALVQSWPEISRLAREGGTPKTEQPGLFETETE